MTASDVPILTIDRLYRSFMVNQGIFSGTKELKAVNGVSLEVRSGEAIGLVGESGCGKTTLAKMLLGLLAPTRGDILVEGVPISSVGRRSLSRKILPIFQDPYSSLNPRKTVGSIVSLPLRIHKKANPSGQRAAVAEMLDLVGLPAHLARAYPNQLSGGQRQRVAIARALILRPKIVICDEPTSALDVSVQAQILNLLIRLRRKLGLTYLLITHDLAVVEHLAERVAVMYLGRVVEETETGKLFDHPRHPYTRALLDSVLTPEPGLGLPDIQLGTAFPNPIDPPSGCSFHPRCPHVMPICRTKKPSSVWDDDGFVECFLHAQP